MRALGKFAVTTARGGLRIHFFDRALNRWDGDHTVPAGADAAAGLLAWAEGIVAGRLASGG